MVSLFQAMITPRTCSSSLLVPFIIATAFAGTHWFCLFLWSTVLIWNVWSSRKCWCRKYLQGVGACYFCRDAGVNVSKICMCNVSRTYHFSWRDRGGFHQLMAASATVKIGAHKKFQQRKTSCCWRIAKFKSPNRSYINSMTRFLIWSMLAFLCIDFLLRNQFNNQFKASCLVDFILLGNNDTWHTHTGTNLKQLVYV